MPIGFYIYREFRLLFIRGHGVITQPERIETMLAWLRDPGYQDCTDALFDVTAAQSIPKLAELRQVIAILEARTRQPLIVGVQSEQRETQRLGWEHEREH